MRLYHTCPYTRALWLTLVLLRLVVSRQDFHANNQITNAPQFYEHLQNRILVQFKPKYEDPDPKSTFEVMLTRKMTYEQVRCARPSLSACSAS